MGSFKKPLHFVLLMEIALFLLRSGGLCFAAEDLPTPMDALDFSLPTENDFIFQGKPESFYQTTISKRKISGMFGFVRTNGPEPPRYFERFHEGIDIKPLRRSKTGEPLDLVKAAAPGTVVYVSSRPALSAYGRYVVIEHEVKEGKVYSLYAHLAHIKVKTGERVKRGTRLGRLGHSGPDLSRKRAHLHFEITVMLQQDWARWFELYGKENPRDRNDHGIFNGINLIGVSPIMVLKAAKKGKPLTLRQIFAGEKPCFRLSLPANKQGYDFQKRFPFLVANAPKERSGETPTSWEVTFNRIGLPLKFVPSTEKIAEPKVTWFDWKRSAQDSFTRGLLRRRGNTATLTKRGRRFVSSLMYHPRD